MTDSRSRRNRHRRHAQFETLSQRHLMAFAAFDLQIRADDNGSPGAIIGDSAVTVEVGDHFFVDVRLAEYHPRHQGMVAGGVDVHWDSAILDVVEESFDLDQVLTEHLPSGRGGNLDNQAGMITGLRADNASNHQDGRPIGDGELETFAMLRFRADTEGTGDLLLGHAEFPNVGTPSITWAGNDILMDAVQLEVLAKPDAPAQNTETTVSSAALAATPTTAEPVVEDSTADRSTINATEDATTEDATTQDEVVEENASAEEVFAGAPIALASLAQQPSLIASSAVAAAVAVEPTSNAVNHAELCDAVFTDMPLATPAALNTLVADLVGPVLPTWFEPNASLQSDPATVLQPSESNALTQQLDEERRLREQAALDQLSNGNVTSQGDDQ